MRGEDFIVKVETDPTKTDGQYSSKIGEPSIQRQNKELWSNDEDAEKCQTSTSFQPKPTSRRATRQRAQIDNFGDLCNDRDVKYCNAVTFAECASLVLILSALASTFAIPKVRKHTLWDLPLWKWEILILVLICGRLLSGWVVRIFVFFIEHNFLFQQKVLYFVYGLRNAVQNCLWLGLVLSVWYWVLNEKVEEEDSNGKILQYVTKILVCFLAGTVIWLFKTIVVKIFALSFHVNTFFERMQKCILSGFIIKRLSNAPEIGSLSHPEQGKNIAQENQSSRNAGFNESAQLKAPLLPTSAGKGLNVNPSPRAEKSSKFSEIKFDQLHSLSQNNISPWSMSKLVEIVRDQSLTTLDEQVLDVADNDQSLSDDDNCEARAAAKKIFDKVAKTDPKYIHVEDLERFLGEDKASRAMDLMCGVEGQHRISKSTFKKWVERKILASSLNDTHTAVDELHNMLNCIIAVIIPIVSLLILGVPVSHFLLFISSQLLLVVFIFGNTCKTIFEALVFLFVTHPFDVGDRCEVDGHEMVVDEMNILSTVFRRADNQLVTYPNSMLSNKCITNFHRSGPINEVIEFCISVSTPMSKIIEMKSKIKSYVEGKNKHWHSDPSVVTTGVENMNKLNMKIIAKHRMNKQDAREVLVRRALLVEELIKILRELNIEYRELPVDTNSRNLSGADRLPSIWQTPAEPSTTTENITE
ncbi:Mechanosensitive ion channel MscS [Dillenia turbinata]|uniref:Mechanosensitive ion channel protein n=1 Tax=Dillenia turbinata TaxID=194707 RepID=A0AAN8W059_9MAGN